MKMTNPTNYLITFVATLISSVGCGNTESELPPFELSLSDSNLSVVRVTTTIERQTRHPCERGRSNAAFEVVYDDWARESAGSAHICLEVSASQLGDTPVSDEGHAPEVYVMFRFNSATTYLRQKLYPQPASAGQSLLYAWSLKEQDPFMTPQVPIGVPFKVLDMDERGWQKAEAQMQVHFVINGRPLTNSHGGPFVIIYRGYTRTLQAQ